MTPPYRAIVPVTRECTAASSKGYLFWRSERCQQLRVVGVTADAQDATRDVSPTSVSVVA